MKVGDKVVCIDPTDRLIKGSHYIIQAIHTMSCGCIVVDIGHDTIFSVRTWCHIHDTRFNNNGVRLYAIERFAPLQYNSAHDKILSEIADNPTERIDVPEKELI